MHRTEKIESCLGNDYESVSLRFGNLLGDFPDIFNPLTLDKQVILLNQVNELLERLANSVYKRGNKLLVTSDSQRFISQIGTIPNTFLICGPIVHSNNSKDEGGIMKVFLEFMTISQAKSIWSISTKEMYKGSFAKSQHCLKENYVINMNRLLKVILRVNWLASIRINCMLPFRQAIRFPILFYGKCECLKIGKLILEIPETNIKLGIIKIGLKFDIGTESPSGAMINHKGTIIFKGSGVFGNGFRLFGDSRSVFIIGHNFVLNGNINVRCEKRIQIGTCFSCSWDTKSVIQIIII